MDADQRKRLAWVRLYEGHGDAGLVCRRCGISRPTLRKWWKRYKEAGVEGLKSRSRRPHRSPNQRVFEGEERLILALRLERRLGIKQLRSELIRQYGLRLSLETIHKVLQRHGVQVLERKRPWRKKTKRYSRPVPGDRVQMDVCKIAPGLYQYTAIDDCSRYRVLGLYPRRTAANTLDFLERVVEEMPFAIQRVQTDRGREFFAYKVQERLLDWAIKFRPIRPRSPHLNGKVERSQKTDLDEFWSAVDLKADDLHQKLDEWQHFYNWHRPHTALNGKSPIDRVCDLLGRTPLTEDVEAAFDPSRERIKEQNYALDQEIRKLQ